MRTSSSLSSTRRRLPIASAGPKTTVVSLSMRVGGRGGRYLRLVADERELLDVPGTCTARTAVGAACMGPAAGMRGVWERVVNGDGGGDNGEGGARVLLIEEPDILTLGGNGGEKPIWRWGFLLVAS